jgi:hypothetical protein
MVFYWNTTRYNPSFSNRLRKIVVKFGIRDREVVQDLRYWERRWSALPDIRRRKLPSYTLSSRFPHLNLSDSEFIPPASMRAFP